MKSKLFLLLAITCIFSIHLSAQNLSINLIEGTLNGKKICTYTIDDITDLLGRPSKVYDVEDIVPEIGPRLMYHDLGLLFWFNPKSKDRSLFIISIHLSQTWDNDASKHYLQYSGEIIPEVNANNKASDIEELFSDYIISIRTVEEQKKALEETGLSNRLGANFNYLIKVGFENNTHDLRFIHEDLTKFLEKVTILCDN